MGRNAGGGSQRKEKRVVTSVGSGKNKRAAGKDAMGVRRGDLGEEGGSERVVTNI